MGDEALAQDRSAGYVAAMSVVDQDRVRGVVGVRKGIVGTAFLITAVTNFYLSWKFAASKVWWWTYISGRPLSYGLLLLFAVFAWLAGLQAEKRVVDEEIDTQASLLGVITYVIMVVALFLIAVFFVGALYLSFFNSIEAAVWGVVLLAAILFACRASAWRARF